MKTISTKDFAAAIAKSLKLLGSSNFITFTNVDSITTVDEAEAEPGLLPVAGIDFCLAGIGGGVGLLVTSGPLPAETAIAVTTALGKRAKSAPQTWKYYRFGHGSSIALHVYDSTGRHGLVSVGGNGAYTLGVDDSGSVNALGVDGNRLPVICPTRWV